MAVVSMGYSDSPVFSNLHFIASVNIYCIESRPNYDTFKGIFSVVYHMLSISFYTMQIGFISFFHKIKFEASKLVNYSLMFILTATVLDYISAVLNDALLDHEHTNATDVRLVNLTDRCYFTSPLRQFYVHLYILTLFLQKLNFLCSLVLVSSRCGIPPVQMFV